MKIIGWLVIFIICVLVGSIFLSFLFYILVPAIIGLVVLFVLGAITENVDKK